MFYYFKNLQRGEDTDTQTGDGHGKRETDITDKSINQRPARNSGTAAARREAQILPQSP